MAAGLTRGGVAAGTALGPGPRTSSRATGRVISFRVRSGPGRGRSSCGRLPRTRSRFPSKRFRAVWLGGRRAIVLVPEAVPVPATAAAILEAFGDRVGMFVGGDKRARYRMWLEIDGGRFDVVVGTRPAVFAPVQDLGLIVVSRESHPAHREDRAPYYHVRDVALERTRLSTAVCVLSALCPSSEADALGSTEVAPSTRRWPPVEVVRAGPEGRASRLVRALRVTHRGFIYSPLPGYGMAQVCRACGRPAACAACGGALRSEEGVVRCIVCEAPGRCAHCGAADFGIRRGGAERVEEWASTIAPVPVRRVTTRGKARLPKATEILVGGPESVRDLGPGGLDLVAILDADLAERRPGLASRERALATWMEAVGMGSALGRGDRAGGQTERPGGPSIGARQPGPVPSRRSGPPRRGRVPCGIRRLPDRRLGGARGTARGPRSHHDARLVRGRADGMLARARARSRERVRSHDPRPRRSRHRGEGRGRTAPVRVRTVEQPT